jgi:hypothetical protein
VQILALRNFLHHRWFGRRWVIQEVLQARTAFAVCGNYSVELGEFVGRITAQLRKTVSTRGIIRAGEESILEKLRYLMSLRQGKEAKGVMMKNMAIVLVQFYTAECTGAHDKLYALNGICSTPIPVDYNASVEETY